MKLQTQNDQIKVMEYQERESIKQRLGYENIQTPEYLIAVWHRFLEAVYRVDYDRPLYLPQNVYPSFELYRKWLQDFPGWSYSRMIKRHSAWKAEYSGQSLPMNNLIDQVEGIFNANGVVRVFTVKAPPKISEL